MKSKLHYTLLCIALASSHLTIAQTKKTSLSFSFGNAPHDFKIGWYEIDNESFDDYDVERYSYSLGTKFERQLSNSVRVRLRASYLQIKFHEYRDAEESYRGALSEQKKLQLAPGIIFPFTRDRFTIYGGFEAIAYFHGEVRTTFTDTNKLFPNSPRFGHYSIIPKGFTYGAAPLMGFNYNLSKTFFLEGEFSSMLMTYGQTGGKTYMNQQGVLVETQDLSKGTYTEPRVSFGAGLRF